LEGFLVEIEIDRRNSPHRFIIVGLPDAAVQEAKERVTSAIKNSGLNFPFHTMLQFCSLIPLTPEPHSLQHLVLILH